MIKSDFSKEIRKKKTVTCDADLIVVGGGMAGVCTSITSARAGLSVVLVQDRPVLGGNASSEVRLWILGATSHMGNNNRWAREGGVIDEILLENVYRNIEGNTLIFDTILLEKITEEPNITLLLNTAVYDLVKESESKISMIRAYCSQNSTEYELEAPLFVDSSGDGIVGFMSGAAFRMGAEGKEEFGEKFAPEKTYGELLGHTMYFYSKKVEHPVKFTPPSFALKDVKQIPRYKILSEDEFGCRLWWIEFGGRRDTVHDTEEIKWELWKIIYGVWDYIKNSGNFKGADNLTLEWVGMIPGKRESRRFEGLYMLKQDDIVKQTTFEDAVSFGGWAVDLHPADGIYSALPGCNQWHSKGIYQIPYRCFVSRDIKNLFYAGRIISATHVAFGSSRVMATSALGGQAVGMAAFVCKKNNQLPEALLKNGGIKELQTKLNYKGQAIPGIPLAHPKDLVLQAGITASSTWVLNEIPFDGPWHSLKKGAGQLLPLTAGQQYQFEVRIIAERETLLSCELAVSSKSTNYTPDVILENLTIELKKGEHFINLDFTTQIPADQYAFVLFRQNESVSIRCSHIRMTGLVAVFNKEHKSVSNHSIQDPPKGIGFDRFEFWTPERRPFGHNIAMKIKPGVAAYDPQFLTNGFTRPYLRSNAWVADPQDKEPTIFMNWTEKKKIGYIQLHFDTDFDHPLESSLMGHPENVMPFCVRNYEIYDDRGHLIYNKKDNHLTINQIMLPEPVNTTGIKIRLDHPSKNVPAGLFEICCFENPEILKM